MRTMTTQTYTGFVIIFVWKVVIVINRKSNLHLIVCMMLRKIAINSNRAVCEQYE